jgi:hypothetical protein
MSFTKSMGASTLLALGLSTGPAAASDIIHDAEHYVLLAQYEDQWAQQDSELNRKLAALREKHGTPPNIIHIMWDDTPVGEVGIPHLQANRGFKTPNMNQFATEGIYFSRMYTEPSCTPSRAAVMTGRHAIRNGMYNVGFPYEYGGLDADEVTIGEVLGEAGYATAFYGKAHLGDVESSYLHKQGFDEAHWSPYNQVPSLYVPRGQRGALVAGTMFPEMFPEDPYDMDKGWRPRGYIWSLEGTKGGPTREWTYGDDQGRPPFDEEGYYKLEQVWQDKTIAFMKKSAGANKPFFIAYWPNINSFLNIRPTEQPALQRGSPRGDTHRQLHEEHLRSIIQAPPGKISLHRQSVHHDLIAHRPRHRLPAKGRAAHFDPGETTCLTGRHRQWFKARGEHRKTSKNRNSDQHEPERRFVHDSPSLTAPSRTTHPWSRPRTRPRKAHMRHHLR